LNFTENHPALLLKRQNSLLHETLNNVLPKKNIVKMHYLVAQIKDTYNKNKAKPKQQYYHQ
jgi:hypothetical protein